MFLSHILYMEKNIIAINNYTEITKLTQIIIINTKEWTL